MTKAELARAHGMNPAKVRAQARAERWPSAEVKAARLWLATFTAVTRRQYPHEGKETRAWFFLAVAAYKAKMTRLDLRAEFVREGWRPSGEPLRRLLEEYALLRDFLAQGGASVAGMGVVTPEDAERWWD